MGKKVQFMKKKFPLLWKKSSTALSISKKLSRDIFTTGKRAGAVGFTGVHENWKFKDNKIDFNEYTFIIDFHNTFSNNLGDINILFYHQ